jgi:hypothetical protein
MTNHPSSESWTLRLRSAWFGLATALLTILFGQGLGIVFGLNEDTIKGRLRASAAAVQATAYQGDAAAMKPVLDKSWAYLQRAHLHAGAMGTTAVALIVLLCLLGAGRGTTTGLGAALGLGGLGYSVYWMWAGFLAPGLGGTSAAKAQLSWLAMPSSGAYVLATFATLVVLLAHAFSRGQPARGPQP